MKQTHVNMQYLLAHSRALTVRLSDLDRQKQQTADKKKGNKQQIADCLKKVLGQHPRAFAILAEGDVTTMEYNGDTKPVNLHEYLTLLDLLAYVLNDMAGSSDLIHIMIMLAPTINQNEVQEICKAINEINLGGITINVPNGHAQAFINLHQEPLK